MLSYQLIITSNILIEVADLPHIALSNVLAKQCNAISMKTTSEMHLHSFYSIFDQAFSNIFVQISYMSFYSNQKNIKRCSYLICMDMNEVSPLFYFLFYFSNRSSIVQMLF